MNPLRAPDRRVNPRTPPRVNRHRCVATGEALWTPPRVADKRVIPLNPPSAETPRRVPSGEPAPTPYNRGHGMRIAIDYSAAVNQRAGIGRLVRNQVLALAEVDHDNDYRLVYARPNRGAVPQFPRAGNFSRR